jgi:hypothetical protein
MAACALKRTNGLVMLSREESLDSLNRLGTSDGDVFVHLRRIAPHAASASEAANRLPTPTSAAATTIRVRVVIQSSSHLDVWRLATLQTARWGLLPNGPPG